MNGFGDPAEIDRLREEMAETFKTRVHYIPADLSKGSEAQMLVKQTIAICGRIDILVNNAGIQHVSPIQDFPDDKWDAVLAINLSSAFHTSKIALTDMQSRGWGPHPQRCVSAWPRGFGKQVRVRGVEARNHRADQSYRARKRQIANHLQRDLPRLGRYATAGAQANRSARCCAKHFG